MDLESSLKGEENTSKVSMRAISIDFFLNDYYPRPDLLASIYSAASKIYQIRSDEVQKIVSNHDEVLSRWRHNANRYWRQGMVNIPLAFAFSRRPYRPDPHAKIVRQDFLAAPMDSGVDQRWRESCGPGLRQLAQARTNVSFTARGAIIIDLTIPLVGPHMAAHRAFVVVHPHDADFHHRCG
jgi:hypothetical protein